MSRALDILKSSETVIEGVKYFIRPLNGLEQFELSGNIQAEDGRIVVDARGCVLLIEKGLTGWINFFDREGNRVDWLPNNRKANLDRIPVAHITPLSTAILNICDIGEEDEKKS